MLVTWNLGTRALPIYCRLCILLLLLVACEPAADSFSETATHHWVETAAYGTLTALPSATPQPSPTETPILPFPTPTQEFCEQVPIEYIVIVPVINVRREKGVSSEVIGQLQEGEHFVSTLCSDPDAAKAFNWVRIVEHESVLLVGGWTALGPIGGENFLE